MINGIAALCPYFANDQAPKLVWSDEFSGPAGSEPDRSKWEFDIGGGGWGNEELEDYTTGRENSHLDGHGNLVITARHSGDKYTSARLKTARRFNVRLGRIEARIKTTVGQGIWPAFWMLGADVSSPNVGWPKCGEIDIMEQIGREPSRIYATVHGPGYSGASAISGHYELAGREPFSNAFHVFGVDWTEDSLTFDLDGNQFHQATRRSLPSGATWVFDHPFFLLLNVAVGGRWPGPPDSTTTFPQRMLVDYVRVYQLAR